jgi:hypothetical protein
VSDEVRELNRAHLGMLANLYEAGGSGEIDIHGRIVVGPTRHPISGDSVAWLKLVSHGYVGGERGKIILTEEGREKAEEVLRGRVRESS